MSASSGVTTNDFGQRIGRPLPAWTGAVKAGGTDLHGSYVSLVALDPEAQADDLMAAFEEDDGRMWTYLSIGPFAKREDVVAQMQRFMSAGSSEYFFTIVPKATGKAAGLVALLRIFPKDGNAEVGFVTLSPQLQRSSAGTEAVFLLIDHVLSGCGYRRMEWKCDSLNEKSHAAALRYGFKYEGTFRQDRVYKGRSRDTSWFSITDFEWKSGLKKAYEQWLDKSNFDEQGKQKRSLRSFQQQEKQEE